MNRSFQGFQVRCREATVYKRLVRTRFPFRFGKASMTEMPVVLLRLELESEKQERFTGVSASGIPPLWFDKRPGKTPADNENDLLRSLSLALDLACHVSPGSAWQLHRTLTEPVRQELTRTGLTPLAAGFGPALVEAAVVDGVCRKIGVGFAAALRGGGLGLPPEDAALLPEKPLGFLELRHTVGLADVLAEADLRNSLQDGLPETLEGVVRTYRPAYFKVKISGDAAETLPRLCRIAEILDRNAGDYAVTLDGNEQFSDMGAFAGFLDRMRAEPRLKDLLGRTLWIEQPVSRDVALDATATSDLAKVSAFKPVIIDESDGEADALERALALGYRGVSSKTCKGLFRSVSHFTKLKRALSPRGGLILSSEDLTTVPVLPLQQDLCLAAALGLTHTERNGHHYIRGFEFLTEAERADALSKYPSLYEADARSGARVRIANGRLHLAEVNAAAGFGSDSVPDWSSLQPISLSAPVRHAPGEFV